VDDQEYRLGVRIDTNQVDPATRKVRELRKELQDLERSDYFSGKAEVRIGLQRQLAAAERSMMTFKAQAEDTGRVSAKSAQGVLALANSVQDFAAAGVRGISNNIPQIIAGLGGGAGLAGAAMLAAVAVDQLGANWDKLSGFFGQSKVETEAERMERLAKATKLTADEARELAAGQERQAAKKAAAAAPDAEQAGGAATVQAMVRRVGGPEAQRMVAAALNRANALPDDEADDTPFQKARREKLRGDAAVLLQRAQGQSGTLGQQDAARRFLENSGINAFEAGVKADPLAFEKQAEEFKKRQLELADEQIRKEKELTAALNEQAKADEKASREAFERQRQQIRAEEEAETKRQAARRDRMVNDLDRQSGNNAEALAGQIAALTLGQAYGGEGLDLGQAADYARGQLAAQYQQSEVFGGMGLNRDAAERLAAQQVQAAFPMASRQADIQAQMFPDAKELARQQAEANVLMRRSLSEGIPIRVRKTGWR
jgi:hypothetical protein